MNMKLPSPIGINWSGPHSWIIVGIGVALLGLVVSMTAVLERHVVPTTQLPRARWITLVDRDHDYASPMISVGPLGGTWHGRQRVTDIGVLLGSLRDDPRGTAFRTIVVRTHHDSLWRDVERVIVAAIAAGFPFATLACRVRQPWGDDVGYLDMRLLDPPNAPAGPLTLRSLDLETALRDRATRATRRKTAESHPAELALELAFPDTANTQSVFSVLECYADEHNTVCVRILKR